MKVPVALAARLARRDLVRSPWRSALVILMILVPTAAMTVATSYVRTGDWSSDERTRANFGSTDAYAYLRSFPLDIDTGEEVRSTTSVSGDDLERLEATLPQGSVILVERSASDRARRGDDRSHLRLSDLRLDDPRLEGRFADLRGRLATTADEVVITESLADDLDIATGDVLAPQRLGRTLKVVGTVRMLATDERVAYLQGTLAPPGAPLSLVSTRVLIDLPSSLASRDQSRGWDGEFLSGNAGGWTVRKAPNGARAVSGGAFLTYTGGVVGLVVLGTIIAAAFGLGARRQLRTLGLLSASGASPSVLRWFLVAQGLVSGLVGSTAGIVTGVILARATPDRFLSSIVDRPVDTATVRPADLVIILTLGVVTAAIAAWLPARGLAQITTLQALAGRRPMARVPLRLPARGVVLIAVGCAFFALSLKSGVEVVAMGALCVMFGTLAIAPWSVAGLEKMSARFPQTWRLSVRSLARNRDRSSAVVGAICAITATVIAGSTLFNSQQARAQAPRPDLPHLRDNQVLLNSYRSSQRESVIATVKSVLPGARVVEVHWVTGDAPGSRVGDESEGRDIYVRLLGREATGRDAPTVVGLATPELLDLLDVPPRLRRALDRGEGIGVANVDGTVRTARLSLPEGTGEVELPFGGTFLSPEASETLPEVLLGPAGLDRLGLSSRSSGLDIVFSPSPVSGGQRRDLQRIWDDLSWEQQIAPPSNERGAINLQVPEESEGVSAATVKRSLLGLSLLTVLAIVAVGLGLAARDTKDERQVLWAVGAPPESLGRLSGLRAFLLVATAAVIAVPAALLPSVAIVAALNADPSRISLPFRPDWPVILFVVVVLPLAAGLMALAAGRLRDLFRPTRPDTFAFAD